MRKISLYTSVFSILLSVFGFSQIETGKKTVQTLCSPEFHGRGYVNGGDSIASEYIAQQFKEIGCSFFKNTPFQAYDFTVNTFPNRMDVSMDGKKLIPGSQFVVDPGSGGGIAENRTVIKVNTADLFDGKDLKNKISETAAKAGSRSKISLALLFPFHTWKGDTLKKAREVAASFQSTFDVITTTSTKFTWSVDQEQMKHVRIEIQADQIDWNKESWTIDYTIDAKLKSHTARNVIAYIPAKKKSKKYFVFTAHYDHLGRMGKDTYFPGGNDNASGTAMLLEMARYYKLNPAKVNIVFIAFSGEEAGLLGSRYYTENPVFDLAKIQFLFNIDIMGSGEDGTTIVNATIFPEQFTAIQKINEEKKYLVKIGSRGKAANSDHYFFSEKGVPAFFMYTAGPNKHYHDVYDTYEELSFAEFKDIYSLLIDFQKSFK
jgi:hypothetical protein